MKKLLVLIVALSGCSAAVAPITIPNKPAVACTATPAQAQALVSFEPKSEEPCVNLSNTECDLAIDFMVRCKQSMAYWAK